MPRKGRKEVESVHHAEKKREREEKMAVLNTPEQVVPVRTHCHPLIGSFLIPPSTQCQCIDGEVSGCQEPARPHWHRIKAGTNAARRQSGKPVHTQEWEHPKTWPHSPRLYHQGVIGTWAFQSIFKGGSLIHMCTMKLAILYQPPPTPPFPSPSSSLQPYCWFRTCKVFSLPFPPFHQQINCQSVVCSEIASGLATTS